jgi:hypothetical protein
MQVKMLILSLQEATKLRVFLSGQGMLAVPFIDLTADLFNFARFHRREKRERYGKLFKVLALREFFVILPESGLLVDRLEVHTALDAVAFHRSYEIVPFIDDRLEYMVGLDRSTQ